MWSQAATEGMPSFFAGSDHKPVCLTPSFSLRHFSITAVGPYSSTTGCVWALARTPVSVEVIAQLCILHFFLFFFFTPHNVMTNLLLILTWARAKSLCCSNRAVSVSVGLILPTDVARWADSLGEHAWQTQGDFERGIKNIYRKWKKKPCP